MMRVDLLHRPRISFILILLLLTQGAFAKKVYHKAVVDSLHKVAVLHRHALADSIRQHVVHEVFSLEYADSLLEQIEHLHTTLNSITNESEYGFKTLQIEKELKTMEAALQVISQNLGRDSTVMNLNNLEMFRGLLSDMGDKLQEWHDLLLQDHQDLDSMTGEMKEFVRDSLTEKVAADTAFANLHLDEMLVLTERWNEARVINKTNQNRINTLQAEVSRSYFEVTELQNVINNELSGSAAKIFRKEYNYLWKAGSEYDMNEVVSLTGQSITERMQMLRYYLRLNPEDWLSWIGVGLVFFFWVWLNFRRIKSTDADDYHLDLSFKYISPVPLLGTLILILNLEPFYSFDQPAIFVEVVQILILIPLTVLFRRLWPRALFVDWCVLALLFVLTSAMNAVITPGWPVRFFLLGLNISSVVFGIRFLMLYDKTLFRGRLVQMVAFLFVVLNCLSVIANASGRLTLAKIFTTAGISGIIQIIGLFVIISMLIEAFYLQMQSSRAGRGMTAKFNFEDVGKGLFRLLAMAVILLWLVTFATNLEVYNSAISFLDDLLNTAHKIGSTTFTVGNIVTFLLILYVVTVLQKYVGYFFGETEEDFIGDLDKKESSLVIFRLIIIMVGFFLAVVASGLPVDKVTVVLGALGVGIGLGLQNIVYNLVSGVILIFEKPMQVGDYIEVADKKGRVQNIGIRSSKLITAEGSEVIVPNGDILSSHMVNWTRSNNNRRTELVMSIEPSSELETAKDILLNELKTNTYVIQGRPVEILVSNFTEKSVDLKLNVWINSVYKEQEFKSDLVSSIYHKLADKGIKIV